jgi:hypothetical protein
LTHFHLVANLDGVGTCSVDVLALAGNPESLRLVRRIQRPALEAPFRPDIAHRNARKPQYSCH